MAESPAELAKLIDKVSNGSDIIRPEARYFPCGATVSYKLARSNSMRIVDTILHWDPTCETIIDKSGNRFKDSEFDSCMGYYLAEGSDPINCLKMKIVELKPVPDFFEDELVKTRKELEEFKAEAKEYQTKAMDIVAQYKAKLKALQAELEL